MRVGYLEQSMIFLTAQGMEADDGRRLLPMLIDVNKAGAGGLSYGKLLPDPEKVQKEGRRLHCVFALDAAEGSVYIVFQPRQVHTDENNKLAVLYQVDIGTVKDGILLTSPACS